MQFCCDGGENQKERMNERNKHLIKQMQFVVICVSEKKGRKKEINKERKKERKQGCEGQVDVCYFPRSQKQKHTRNRK